MAQTCTTSIRMDEQLAQRLNDAAAKLHRRKNGIIVHAIVDYLDRHAELFLREEAAQQSLLASRLDASEEIDGWESSHDSSGWQS